MTKFGLDSSKTLLDPFCGTGTTIVEAKRQGIPSVGIEAHPMAHFASKVKTDWDVDPFALQAHAEEVAETVTRELGNDGVEDDPVFADQAPEPPNLKTLPDEQAELLLRNSISPLPLHKVLTLLCALRSGQKNPFLSYELLALATSVVSSSSNLKFGPEVGVTKPKRDCPVIQPWLRQVKSIAEDLRKVQNLQRGDSATHCADAREVKTLLNRESIDAVITSPPYPNEKDYTRTTRLETVLLGFITSRAELRNLKNHMVRSNTRGVYKNDDDDKWIASHEEIQRIASLIENRRVELGKTSGFERLYPRVTKLYFGGMAKHLASLRYALRPGAQLAYVVGGQASYLRIMIRTGRLLSEIADSLGYEVVGIDLFRTRLATATRDQLREEVVLLRWPG
jgi:hypothetical protein